MARARNIKPGFFKNEILVELPYEFRLLFIGLWTLADREGRLEDRPSRVKMELFPADNIDVQDGLSALHDKGFIFRFEANGSKFIQVLAWHKHQTPHHKEQASTIPAPCFPGLSPMHALGMPGTCPSDCLIPDSLIASKPDEPQLTLPAWLPEKAWSEFVDHRKKIKKPMTDNAMVRMVGHLEKLKSQGVDVIEQMDVSIRCGWQDVFAPKGFATVAQPAKRKRELL